MSFRLNRGRDGAQIGRLLGEKNLGQIKRSGVYGFWEIIWGKLRVLSQRRVLYIHGYPGNYRAVYPIILNLLWERI